MIFYKGKSFINKSLGHGIAGNVFFIYKPQTVTDALNRMVTNNYNNLNRLEEVIDPAGNITRYGYDDLDRLTSVIDAINGTGSQTFDAVGNLETLTYPDLRQVTYQYSPANLLKSVTDWAGRITTYDYDKNGRMITTTRPDGTVLNCDYDDAGQLRQMKDIDAQGNVISQHDFTYDNVGNVETEQVLPESGAFTLPDTVAGYTYDNRVQSFNGQSVEYDADGNMTLGPLNGHMVNFEYDVRNQLTSAGSSNYQYDAEGNRISVIDGVYRDSYVINPHAPLSQVLVKTDDTGNQTYYVYGLGLIGQEENGVYQTYHFDIRGSTVALTDVNGKVTDRFQYNPYGELVSRSGITATPFLFSGRYGVMADFNGLNYMRTRYYNPVAKRFLSLDSIVGRLSNLQSLNRYIYCKGNPVMYVDPMGLDAVVLVDSGAVFGAGHIAIIVFDTQGNGYYYSQGSVITPKTIPGNQEDTRKTSNI